VEDEETFCHVLVDFATERTDFVPMGTQELVSWSILVTQQVLVNFILPSALVGKGGNSFKFLFNAGVTIVTSWFSVSERLSGGKINRILPLLLE
jgi:hypothetical protein